MPIRIKVQENNLQQTQQNQSAQEPIQQAFDLLYMSELLQVPNIDPLIDHNKIKIAFINSVLLVLFLLTTPLIAIYLASLQIIEKNKNNQKYSLKTILLFPWFLGLILINVITLPFRLLKCFYLTSLETKKMNINTLV